MDFEKQHKLNVLIYQQRVNRIYDEAIKIAAQMGITAKLDTEGDFQWSDFPQFAKRVEEMIENLEKQLEANIVSGINSEWNLANKKADQLATKVVGEKDSLPVHVQKVYFGHNEEARDAFINRKANGLNLSERVWKLGEQFKTDTELGISAVLQDGLKNGKSAEEMGRKVKQYLNEPNRIFRRRRNKETGELELSKPAQNYHPGQGVYRSSRKNALRLTGTETNMAFRNADYERVKNFDFVLGVRVVVSNNHPVKDICDELAGVYPKGFRFIGWHPHCRCHTETILKSNEQRDEERRKRREAWMNDEPIPKKTNEGEITKMPKNWQKWVNENRDKIDSAEKRGKLPWFLQQNKWAITENEAPAVTPVVLNQPKITINRNNIDFEVTTALKEEINNIHYDLKKSLECALPKVQKKLNKIEVIIRKDAKNENAKVINSEGEVIASEKGYQSYIDMSQIGIKISDCILTHNHTKGWSKQSTSIGRTGSSFSKEDVMFAIHEDLLEIRAVTPIYTFSITRPANGWCNLKDFENVYNEELLKTISKLRERYSKNSSEYVIEQNDAIYAHIAIKNTCKRLGLQYRKKKVI